MTVRFMHSSKNKLLNYLFLKNDFNPNLKQIEERVESREIPDSVFLLSLVTNCGEN